MIATGLPPPPSSLAPAIATAPMAAPFGESPVVASVAPAAPMAEVVDFGAAMQARKQQADSEFRQQQAAPVLSGLATHIKKFWSVAEAAKLTPETQMLEAMLARRGEYTAEKKQLIQQQNQPAIYMMVASSKMRQIEALVRDVFTGTGADKPWTLRPTAVPTLPPSEVRKIVGVLQSEIETLLSMGVVPTMEQTRERLRMYREQLDSRLREEAAVRCERMERKMEDQLTEGGFLEALDGFITDLATFKTAFIKGPVVRNRPTLSWSEDGQLTVETKLSLHWERVDPFKLYPAPWAKTIDESSTPLIELHSLTRESLNEMIGVDGFSEAAIKKVLEEYGTSGLHQWLRVESQKAEAEGKDQLAISNTGTIDAIQFWGSASGQMLLDWGMEKAQVPEPTKEYQIEAWLIGPYVIKAVLNADPLARRPYYGDSFQRVPGSVWGNSPYDLLRDCADMCNAAARSLAANLGISSGPQVAVLTDRLPVGEDLTEMVPWKVWQFKTDMMGSTANPISFFQPQSNAAELMQVFERYSQLADEAVGIPRYMAGFNSGSGGAGRTASGMSMMIGNASKVIKQVVSGIDTKIMTKLLERQFYYNMRYLDDPDLKGDVAIVARGAQSLATKEVAQVRRNEFLQATANPFDMQIMGMEGRAEVLRASAGGLDMNTDKVVPPVAVIKEKAAMLAMQQAQTAADQPGQGTPPNAQQGGQELMNGAPVTDNFEPA